MLIALNMTPRTVLTGPDVGIHSKILITKASPHFFYNPIITEPKDLQDTLEGSKLQISYKNYTGEDAQITISDEDGSIQKAINQLHNGIARVNAKKD